MACFSAALRARNMFVLAGLIVSVSLSTALPASAQYSAAEAGRINRERALAEKLHIHALLDQPPLAKCMTWAVEQAIATLLREQEIIENEIRYISYNAVNVSHDGTIERLPSPGAEQEYADLQHMSLVAALMRDRLYSLQPCDVEYRPFFDSGMLLGVYVIKSVGGVVMTETLIRTDQTTNQFSDYHDPVGVGGHIAYAFAPFHNSIVVSPFVSFDYLGNPVNHNFAGGSYLGSRSNFSGTAGVKVGPALSPSVQLYGIAGVSTLNETLTVNFLPVLSSTDKTVAGGTIGAGFAYKPPSLQTFGRPVSLFVEYTHTWWQDAQFNSPAASPLFNYNFRRQDDVVKVGFDFYFGAPASPSPAKPDLYVKAR